jgi:hypothetical protein
MGLTIQVFFLLRWLHEEEVMQERLAAVGVEMLVTASP